MEMVGLHMDRLGPLHYIAGPSIDSVFLAMQ